MKSLVLVIVVISAVQSITFASSKEPDRPTCAKGSRGCPSNAGNQNRGHNATAPRETQDIAESDTVHRSGFGDYVPGQPSEPSSPNTLPVVTATIPNGTYEEDSGWGGTPLSPGVRPGRNGSSAAQGPEGDVDYVTYCRHLGPRITELNQYLQEMTRQGYSQAQLKEYIELRDSLQAQLDGGVCEWDPNRTTHDF